MGTREVYEEKLRSGNLHHDPTINPGLGSARCPRCLSLINPNSDSGEWAITPVLHDVTTVAGSGAGGMLSAVYSFNSGIPFFQKRVNGPKWLPFVIGVPPLLVFSAASAAFGGYALPSFGGSGLIVVSTSWSMPQKDYLSHGHKPIFQWRASYI